MANVNATIKETVSGIAVAKNFRQEAGIFAEFDQANRQSYQVNVRRGLVLSMVFPVLNALSGVGNGADGVRRRAERGAGDRHRGGLVSCSSRAWTASSSRCSTCRLSGPRCSRACRRPSGSLR